MMRRLAVPALFLLALPACNGVVVDGPSGTTSAGGAGGGSTGDVGSSGGSGGIGGTGGSTGGSGGAPSCKETHDALSVSLSTWQGKTFGCNQDQGDFQFSAQVVDTPGPGLFVLDSCSPAADCIPFISKLSITAPDIYIDLPKGAYVTVHVAVEYVFQGGCSQRIQIKNLPMWDGVPNPVMGGDNLWFLGVDGGAEAFADTPFVATPEVLGCSPGNSMGCGEHKDYLWHFQAANDPGDPGVSVLMGETGYLGASLPGGFQFVSVHNLRSFSSGICDVPVDFAYWMKHEYPLD